MSAGAAGTDDDGWREGGSVFVAGGTEPVTSAAFVAVSYTGGQLRVHLSPSRSIPFRDNRQGFAPFYFPFLFLEKRYFLFTFKKRKILPYDDVLSLEMACRGCLVGEKVWVWLL